MGDTLVVGLVVPAADGARAVTGDSSRLSGAAPNKRPNRTSTRRSENSVTLTIAIQALQNARMGLDALQPGMLKHERERLLVEPLSQLGLATRAIEEAEERLLRGLG